MKKIERLLTIVLSLKQSGKLTAAKLAEQLEVNVRTIYRDIDALSQMEVPVISEPGSSGGYSISDDYFLPVFCFSEDELLALKLSHKLLNEVKLPGFNAAVDSAFLKIESANGVRQDHNILDYIIFDLAGARPEIENLNQFDKIRHAIGSRKTVEIRYFSPNKMEERIREVEPWILKYYNGCWYLTGNCLNSRGCRTFRLDRIKSIRLTSRDFEYPPAFNLSEYDRNSSYQNDVLAPGEGSHLVLKIKRSLYLRDKELLLLKYYDFKPLNDEWGELSINTNYPEDFAEYAVKHFPDAVIEGNEELKKAIKEKLYKIIEHY